MSSTLLPVDIRVETIVAVFVICLGVVTSAERLKPVSWSVWAGSIEKNGGSANPFRGMEERPGFFDIRVRCLPHNDLLLLPLADLNPGQEKGICRLGKRERRSHQGMIFSNGISYVSLPGPGSAELLVQVLSGSDSFPALFKQRYRQRAESHSFPALLLAFGNKSELMTGLHFYVLDNTPVPTIWSRT